MAGWRLSLPYNAAMQFRSLPLSIERFLLSPFSLLLALFLAFFLNAYSLPLTDVDEGAFSEATREMMARGNLVSPTLNDAPRHDKPILIYWAQAASVAVLGVSEIGFRLPSIIFALLWVFALFRFCVRHGNQMTAQIASLVMALTLVVGFIAKAAIADALLKITGLTRLYERSDANVRSLEGLPEVTGWLRGEGPTEITIREHDWQLTLDIATGHKTGFYLDQRDSRHRFAQHTRHRRFGKVLNCYCYTGGFTVAALAGGAGHVTSIDSSAPALDRARAHVRLNGFDESRATFMDADVNASLRAFIEAGETFDAIVLDPPKFAPTAAHADRAARAYKDINRLAFKLLSPGGELFTYSCSGGISADLFHKIVASAGTDAGVDGFISERLQGAPDHPMTINFPEGEYLKGLVVVRK